MVIWKPDWQLFSLYYYSKCNVINLFWSPALEQVCACACSWSRKTAPQHDSPTTMVNCQKGLGPCLCQTKAVCPMCPKSSSLVSSGQKSSPCFECLQENFSRALMCNCMSNGFFFLITNYLEAHYDKEPSQHLWRSSSPNVALLTTPKFVSYRIGALGICNNATYSSYVDTIKMLAIIRIAPSTPLNKDPLSSQINWTAYCKCNAVHFLL